MIQENTVYTCDACKKECKGSPPLDFFEVEAINMNGETATTLGHTCSACLDVLTPVFQHQPDEYSVLNGALPELIAAASEVVECAINEDETEAAVPIEVRDRLQAAAAAFKEEGSQ